MKVQEGKIGRVFVLAFDHNEELLTPLKNFIIDKNIRAGFIQLLGAIQKGDIVCGPQETVVPPTPIKKEIQTANELIGIGSICWENDQPKIHLHAALGRAENALLGCIRGAAKVYITIEAMITEITGVTLTKNFKEELGLSTL